MSERFLASIRTARLTFGLWWQVRAADVPAAFCCPVCRPIYSGFILNTRSPALIKAASAMTNADPHELQKFSDLAHRWWDPNAEFKPLHELNPVRLNWIDAQAHLAGKRVLDIGCGGGILTESMAGLGAHVKGIDLSSQALGVADLHSLESGVTVDYEEIAAEALAAREPGTYDVVTCMEMLEHVPEPAAIVAACKTLVKPGGWVFFSTLNRNVKSYLFAVIGAEYIARMLPKGT
jgi:2-polyprenyl-6-hydroxyphenyl methylase / 3-demethylubiquinone-9 3-methyltransferase